MWAARLNIVHRGYPCHVTGPPLSHPNKMARPIGGLARSVARVAAVGVGSALLAKHRSLAHADAAPPPDTQWLWTFDGTTLRRSKDGELLFYDSATGDALGSRPEHVPKEAYASRWRSPPHPGWDGPTSRKVSTTKAINNKRLACAFVLMPVLMLAGRRASRTPRAPLAVPPRRQDRR